MTAVISMLAVERTANVHGGMASMAAATRGTRIAITVPAGL
jgi:hypothetical protein